MTLKRSKMAQNRIIIPFSDNTRQDLSFGTHIEGMQRKKIDHIFWKMHIFHVFSAVREKLPDPTKIWLFGIKWLI